MGIRVALKHRTEFNYDRPVSFGPHTIRLRPAPHSRTTIHSYSLSVEPKPHFLNWQQDPYNNYLARVVFPKPAKSLTVTVDLIAELIPINPFDFFIEDYAKNIPFQYEAILKAELAPYLETLPCGPKFAELVAEVGAFKGETNDFLVELNTAIYRKVKYLIRLEPGVQSPDETLDTGSGSCRDSAWLLVQVARHLGYAARFCSGYLIQLVADEKPVDGPEGPVADFTDLHAWAEVFVPGAGWIGLDATSGLLTAEGHIPLACTADPQTAAPISGAFGFEKDDSNPDDVLGEEFKFHMSVDRIDEAPRVTKPYTDAQWRKIDELGHRVDNDLREWDVRLTMGGEPTFVSIDDRESEEWNTAALGPKKRQQAMVLLKRLRDRWATGSLLHFGQGKWYPGEQLPRWAFGCYWRKDGDPIWIDPELVADEAIPYGFGAAKAEEFIQRLAENLAVDPKYAQPGYEDAWYYMWKERRLPVNVDPLKSKLEDPLERARLAKVFEQNLGSIVGYVLPLKRGYYDGPKWESGPWFLRQEHLFLIPGDSPMGLRLPLDSLPWMAPEHRQFIEPRDPFAPRGPLPRMQTSPASGVRPSRNGKKKTAPGDSSPDGQLVKTALCVEPRNGKLYIFMPPVLVAEDYLDLVAAIELTAAELGTPVLLEGYKPPSDHRINHFSVTPDPGVIEVNVHPAGSWKDLTEITTSLYEEAKAARLSTEKFMLDGRHAGTGGGNHMVLGGNSAGDSPFLRRPDLIKSLVTFWNNHPSLSFLFSGMFVGPTSQHPRIDEARNDSLYEFEIAAGHLASTGRTPPAWLVDRSFRNLLIDVTGNTHRTEFCIDKMYSPDSTEGRKGLLEFRAFEMPPHSQMSLVQQLMIRSLVSWFWKKPYQQKIVRWGTELHDRFMLPHFVERDFNDLLDELKKAGYAFDPQWFVPHLEFRFPLLGEVTQRDVNLKLRNAIEPWHVLGEEMSSGGAARYVDSSVERVQVLVRGLTDPRHVITCNGRRVPLHPTGTHGEYVAGVRYRAWQPPSCLHPSIPVQSPLTFDILDTWNDRSIGGCSYHVSHPGGRADEVFPLNAREAESRRIARFFTIGHTPGSVAVPPEEPNAEFPYTLDLRRPVPKPPEQEIQNRIAAAIGAYTVKVGG
jgi:uncharacterized protein (DUF2126 family)/transglutaminase-like putative cysteine protease